MNERIATQRDYLLAFSHHHLRRDVKWNLAQNFASRKLQPMERAAEGLANMLAAEKPAFLADERIAYIRTVKQIPDLYTEEEMSALRAKAYYHEKGVVFNFSPDFGSTIKAGLLAHKQEIQARMKRATDDNDQEGQEFLASALCGINAVLDLAERYRQAAVAAGRDELAKLLARVPAYGASTFHEALQFLRILHYTLWCEGEYHVGIGRFDQYIYPYLKADLDAGRISKDEAYDLLAEFFLSFNRDSDLYVGVQQGDNGQTLMLGGCTRDGQDAYNLLTSMCLEVCCELKLIDPKINLRITPRTPLPVLELATQLTKQGLGFPQYSNDDVVIPALVKFGYELEDARDYSVAACWEFIIPGCGMDIPNIGAFSMPRMVDTVMRNSKAKTFDDFMADVRQQTRAEADKLEASLNNVDMLPGPFASVLCTGRIDAARDVSRGNKYNNFGVHGTGLATAADSLMAIKQLVFMQKRLTLAELVTAVDDNFNGQPELLAATRYDVPKMGNDNDDVDALGTALLDAFADAWAGRRNCRGGIWRAGTGSAMYYIWHANELPASPDGRLKGHPFPANYAPSLNVRVKGPMSVVKSFTKEHLQRVCNGGPLTLEIHDSAFREADGIRKVAQLVQFFAQQGGHQLQLNAVNRDRLKEAQKHPEAYRNLIVRVWGWSGYFIELDKEYQDHVIQRVEMSMGS